MRKGLIAIGATAFAVLAPTGVSIASDDPGNGQGPPRDSAIGSGTSGNMKVAFAAFGGPSPADVTGHFRSGGSILGIKPRPDDPTAFQLEGPVTCLNVKGNEARLVYPVKQGKPEAMENSEIYIFVHDAGKPEQGQSSNDEIGFEILPDTTTPGDDPPSEQNADCNLPFTGGTSKLDKGDITVRDATP